MYAVLAPVVHETRYKGQKLLANLHHVAYITHMTIKINNFTDIFINLACKTSKTKANCRLIGLVTDKILRATPLPHPKSSFRVRKSGKFKMSQFPPSYFLHRAGYR